MEMPEQPPTPSRVEELLRASAQRRRAEFDAEVGGRGREQPPQQQQPGAAMPAAMRQRLHEEILSRRTDSAIREMKTAPERAPGSPRVGLFTLLSARFWPRFALAAAAVVALLALPFLWRSWRPAGSSSGAMVASQTTVARQAEPTVAAAPTAAPELRQTPPPVIASAPPPPAPRAPHAAATPAATVPAEPTTLADAATPAPVIAAAKPSPSVALAEQDAATRSVEGLVSAVKTDARGGGGAESGLRQSFARNEISASRATTASRRSGAVDATKDASAGGGNNVATASADDVLTNFRLEQTGDRVRIVDSDGSVYTGEIQPLVAAAETPAVRARTDALAQSAATSTRTAPRERRLAAAPADRDAARASTPEASGSGDKKGEDERAAALSATQRGRFAASGPPPAPAARQRVAPESQPKPVTSAPGGGSAQTPTQAQRPATSADIAQTETSAALQKQKALTETRGDAGAANTTGAAFSFRASGANVSLRKPVIFEGTYYPALSPYQTPAAEANLELTRKQETVTAKSAAPRATQQSRAKAGEEKSDDETAAVADAPRVIGRARVAGREVSVDASAVSR